MTIDMLAEPDLTWIETVVDVVEQHAGQPWRVALESLDDLQRALQLCPPATQAWHPHAYAPDRAHPTVARRFRAVVSALQRITSTRARNARLARRARSLVLGHPALDPPAREARIAHAAAILELSPQSVETILWSDLPRERPIELPAGRPHELEIAAYANVSLLQYAVRNAGSLTLTIDGDDVGPIVRAASACGLLVSATTLVAATDDATTAIARTRVEIAGPLSLVRRTSVYGRALSRVVPLLATLPSWSLEVTVELPLATHVVRIASPVLLPWPSARDQRQPYAMSRLRQALERACPDLAITAAPPMLRSGERLLFPDLAVDVAGRRTYVEIVGFWTRAYLESKVAAYAAIDADVLLCADIDRGADERELPAEVMPYRKRVLAAHVLGRLGIQ